MSAPRRKLKHNFPFLALNSFCACLRFFAPVGILAFASLTHSYAMAMGVFSTIEITQALLEIPTGVISDRWGRRKCLVCGSFLETFTILCYTLAFHIPNGTPFLFLGAIAFGATSAFFSGNNNALIHETLAYYGKEEAAAHLFGRISSTEQASLALSGLVGAFLLWQGFSFGDLVLFSLPPVALSFLFALLVQDPPRQTPPHRKILEEFKTAYTYVRSNKDLAWIGFASALDIAVGLPRHNFRSAFIQTVWPLWLTPAYRTLQSALGTVAFWFSGKIVKKYGETKVLFRSSLAMDFLSLLAFETANFASPLLLLLTQAGWAVSTTADSAIQQKLFSDDQRSTLGSAISFTGALMASITSVLVGYMADKISPASTLIVLVLAGMPATWIYYYLIRRQKLPRA